MPEMNQVLSNRAFVLQIHSWWSPLLAHRYSLVCSGVSLLTMVWLWTSLHVKMCDSLHGFEVAFSETEVFLLQVRPGQALINPIIAGDRRALWPTCSECALPLTKRMAEGPGPNWLTSKRAKVSKNLRSMAFSLLQFQLCIIVLLKRAYCLAQVFYLLKCAGPGKHKLVQLSYIV